MSSITIGIIIGVFGSFCVIGLGLVSGIYIYHYIELKKNKNSRKKVGKTKSKDKSESKINKKKISSRFKQRDIGNDIKQTKVSINSTTKSINSQKSNK